MPTSESYAVPQDVWDAIVPQAQATDAHERRVTLWVLAASLVLVVASWFATQAGFFGPRLTSNSSSESHADSDAQTGQITIDVENTGRLGTRITGARLRTAASSALRVTAVQLTPGSLGGRATASLAISYAVTDCDAFRAVYGDGTDSVQPSQTSADTIEVEATTWWGGTRSVSLQPIGAIVGDLIAPACTPVPQPAS